MSEDAIERWVLGAPVTSDARKLARWSRDIQDVEQHLTIRLISLGVHRLLHRRVKDAARERLRALRNVRVASDSTGLVAPLTGHDVEYVIRIVLRDRKLFK